MFTIVVYVSAFHTESYPKQIVVLKTVCEVRGGGYSWSRESKVGGGGVWWACYYCNMHQFRHKQTTCRVIGHKLVHHWFCFVVLV